MRNCPEGKQRYKLLLSYDGTGCNGWQRQGHDEVTIQETLEKSISKFYNTKINVVASGRTDAGVHAQGQIAHFDAIPDPMRTKKLVHAVNGMTPHHIVIKGAWEAPADFHAIHSTLKKTYKYRVFNSRYPSAFFGRVTHWINWDLNLDFLNECASHITGEHDFKSFQTKGTPTKSTVRVVLEARWYRRSPELIEFTITGTGFLKQMVRNLVGTMLELQRTGGHPSQMKTILEAKDRRKAGPTAEPRGLSLYKVYYPQRLDIGCRKI